MRSFRCFLLLWLIAVVGCHGGGVALPTAPVAGTVTYRGKPLNAGRIIFFHPSGQAVGANIAANGSVRVAAFQGKNQVAVELFAPGRPNPNPDGRPRMLPGASLIPDHYANPKTSDLTLDVKPCENSRAEFTLID
jgi:hypothetical protein